MSSTTNEPLDVVISQTDGSTDSYNGTYYWIDCDPGFSQLYMVTMPFAVSKCDITIISFETNKLSWTNRTDGKYIDDNGDATVDKSTGSVFSINNGDTINIAHIDCNPTGYYISKIEYQLKLYSGYLEYGVNCTKGTGGGSVHARLPGIRLNVIARV